MERPKLLLADDSVTIRKVVELTFADEGIDVTAVADADSAMQRFVETQPDIVLVDATLAGTSGYRICEMIKADDATKHIPVLLLTGSFERFDDDEAVRVGADGFMTKPFRSIRELVAKVRDLLDAGDRNGAGSDAKVEEMPPVPVFGEAFSDGRSAAEFADSESKKAEPSEDDDIDHLYRESFGHETSRPGSEPALEEDLGHVGMDDDMIEASYQPPRIPADNEEEPIVPLRDEYDPEQKFDWSPEELVGDPEPQRSGGFEPLSVFADDEPKPSGNPHESSGAIATGNDDSGLSGTETIEIDRPEGLTSGRPPRDADGDDESEILDLGLDATPAPHDFVLHPEEELSVTAEDEGEHYDGDEEATVREISAEQTIDESGTGNYDDEEPDPAIHETIPYAVGEQPPIQEPEGPPRVEQLPQEVIDMIAQRVIEKLSDSVVREVARIEVPRVAEKLIREALDGKR